MDTVTLLYTSNGMVFGAAFLPQIVTLIKDRSGAVSMNLATWGLFTLCSLITLVYACTHNGDNHFIFCSAIGTLGNTMIFMLGSLRRLQYSVVYGHSATAQKR